MNINVPNHTVDPYALFWGVWANEYQVFICDTEMVSYIMEYKISCCFRFPISTNHKLKEIGNLSAT